LKFSSDLLEEIRNHCDIVDVISEYVPLKPAGRSFKGLCPFHEEKTPSFMVSPEKQLFHCFGCGEGGNVFTFIKKFEKVNFVEAVEILAKKAGIALPTDERKENFLYKKKEKLYEINELTAKYYQECLLRTDRGKKVINYLKKRGIEESSVEKYKIGYAPTGWDVLAKFLIKRNYSYEEQLQVGLVKKSKLEGRYIDCFRDRVIFPIFNFQGRIVGFGGRTLGDSLPKYINSPETLIYNKGSNLYNINFAKEDIRRNKRIIIVEGYTDVLIVQQYGFNEVAASLGTALTVKQIELIKRLTDNAFIAYDSDLAGNLATLRSMDLMIKVGLEVKVISLPTGDDPADFLVKKGNGAFQSLIDNALSLIDYKLKLLYLKYGFQSIEGKIKIVKEILPTLCLIETDNELTMQIEKISEKLKLPESSIRTDFRKYKKGIKEFTPSFVNPDSESGNIQAEKILIGCMLENEKIAQKVLKELEVEDFTVSLHYQIVSTIKKYIEENKKCDSQKIIDSLNDKQAENFISKILMEKVITFDEKVISGYIDTIKNIKYLQEKKNLEKKAKLLDEKIKKSKKIKKDDLIELSEILKKLKH